MPFDWASQKAKVIFSPTGSILQKLSTSITCMLCGLKQIRFSDGNSSKKIQSGNGFTELTTLHQWK